LNIYPNPSSGEAININYVAQNEATEFVLRDMNGKLIASQVITATNTEVSTQLNNTQNLPAGCYLLKVQTGDYATTKKIVVL
jgi:5-hydroxyisourate hydrolase-like protein (transthyretin family)